MKKNENNAEKNKKYTFVVIRCNVSIACSYMTCSLYLGFLICLSEKYVLITEKTAKSKNFRIDTISCDIVFDNQLQFNINSICKIVRKIKSITEYFNFIWL
jgi:hypothetical protein